MRVGRPVGKVLQQPIQLGSDTAINEDSENRKRKEGLGIKINTWKKVISCKFQ